MKEFAMFDKILVPVDGSPTSCKGLAEAIAVARLTGGRIRLLHVLSDPLAGLGSEAALVATDEIFAALRSAGERVLADAKASVGAAGIEVDEVLFESCGVRLCDRVVETARSWPASLIVMGTHGRRGLDRLMLGSDAEQILRTAPVPILLIRGDTPCSAP
jgi:nucleotide-binding universal stress UspA family protein